MHANRHEFFLQEGTEGTADCADLVSGSGRRGDLVCGALAATDFSDKTNRESARINANFSSPIKKSRIQDLESKNPTLN